MSAVNTPTIRLTDNADGTGCVCTVSGSTTGSTNAIYAAQWAGGFVGQSYASYGSRTGDGTVSLSLGPGYWFIYCKSTKTGQDGANSLVGGVRVTDGEEALWFQCLDAIVAKLQTLSLQPPWQSDRIVSQKFPWNRALLKADIREGIYVTPLNDQYAQRTNQSDDWGLGCQITVVQATNQHLTNGLSAAMLCRQQIVNALLPKAGEAVLAAVPEVLNLIIEPGPAIDPAAFQLQYDVGAIVARCIVRQTRLLT